MGFTSCSWGPKPRRKGTLGPAQLAAPQPRMGQRSPPPLGEGVSSEDLVALGSGTGAQEFFVRLTSL